MGLAIDLSGKRAIVTGVTQGIGAGIARRLAEAGCQVAGCATHAAGHADAERFLADMAERGRRGFYFQADLAESASPARFIAEAAAALGGIDLLISNAGRNFFHGAAACTEREWAECMELDLASHWRLAREAKAHLEAAGAGVLVFISSNHAFGTLPGCFPYNVAKAGINALVQSLALEWGPRIRAVGVAPGFVDTPGTEAWFNSFPDPAGKRAVIEAAHPAGRIGTPAEIGALCAFLASEHARFITGTTLLADGGRSAGMHW